jgi:hypothetical protein
MVMQGYTKTKKLGTFRRFALAQWGDSKDGRIYGTMFFDYTNCIALAKKVEAEHGIKLTPTHFIGKAVALGLKESPCFNAKLIWGTFYEKEDVDIFFQVDIESGKDLSGVVIRKCDRKTIVEIAQELRASAEKLRKGEDKQYEKTQKGVLGKLPIWLLRRVIKTLIFCTYNLGIDLSFLGAKVDPFGTVMISNVGPMGIDIAYAPLVPPARIPLVTLIGRVTDQPHVVDGKVEVRPILTGSATFDHRYGDGAHIGRLIRKVREYMENPWVDPPVPVTAPAPAAVAAPEPAKAAPEPDPAQKK